MTRQPAAEKRLTVACPIPGSRRSAAARGAAGSIAASPWAIKVPASDSLRSLTDKPSLAPGRIERSRRNSSRSCSRNGRSCQNSIEAARGDSRSNAAAAARFRWRISRVVRDRLLERQAAFERCRLLAGPGADLRPGAGASRNKRPPPASSTRSTGPRRRTWRLTDFQWKSSAAFCSHPIRGLFGCRRWCRTRTPLAEAFHQHHADIGQAVRIDGGQRHRGGIARLAAAASSNQAANSRKGSSASVKSPPVNPLGCSIGADSDIRGAIRMVASPPSSLVQRASYRGRRGAFHVAVRWLATGPWLLVLALTGGGCSLAYQLDTTLGKRDGADHWRTRPARCRRMRPQRCPPRATSPWPAPPWAKS